MYLTVLKSAIVEALRATFDSDYPEPDFRDTWCSIEFPIEQANYPGIWVQYEDTQELSIAGIDHQEFTHDEVTGDWTAVTRWKFKGQITGTCVALSSLERDRLFDEVVRTFAFGRYEPDVSAFRTKIEQNDLISINISFDDLRPGGDAAAPGTPWGTDEFIYEKSVSMDVVGEFVSGPLGLISLSKITIQPYPWGTPEPAFTGNPPDDQLDPGLPNYPPDWWGTWKASDWT